MDFAIFIFMSCASWGFVRHRAPVYFLNYGFLGVQVVTVTVLPDVGFLDLTEFTTIDTPAPMPVAAAPTATPTATTTRGATPPLTSYISFIVISCNIYFSFDLKLSFWTSLRAKGLFADGKFGEREDRTSWSISKSWSGRTWGFHQLAVSINVKVYYPKPATDSLHILLLKLL